MKPTNDYVGFAGPTIEETLEFLERRETDLKGTQFPQGSGDKQNWLIIFGAARQWLLTPAVEGNADLMSRINAECKYGFDNFGPFNSAHEGFAVLLEEVDELKAHVWAKQKNRDLEAMQKEAVQVAAMAVRFALEVCSEDRGRK